MMSRPFSLMGATALPLLLAGGAAAQTIGYTCSGTTCTVPAGTYTTPAQTSFTTGSSYTAENAGTISVQIIPNSTTIGTAFGLYGPSGANSTDNDAGNGSPSGNLTYTNSGPISVADTNGATFGTWITALHAWTQGGNGGNYTNDNAKHNAGAAANAGGLTFGNATSIAVNPTTGIYVGPGGFGALVESTGGAGGNVTSIGPDHNGNPQYHNQIGTAGAAGGAVTVTNTGSITAASVQVTGGFWTLAARSIGGNGGTGNDGTAGGGAGTVSITNSAPVSLDLQWSSAAIGLPAGTPLGAYAIYAGSLGGNGNMSVNSGNDGGAGGQAGAVTLALNANGPVGISTAAESGALVRTGAGALAISQGGDGGAGYDSSTGGKGGASSLVTVGITGTSVTARGDQTAAVIAAAMGGKGGAGGIGQDNSNGGAGGNSGLSTDTTPDVQVQLSGATVSAAGVGSPGVFALSQGGTGGAGTNYSVAFSQGVHGGNGGGGGNTGPISVTLDSGSSVSTSGDQSPGILAVTLGGTGGVGGDMAGGEGHSGAGGTGGQAAPVTVHLTGGTSIVTTGGPGSGTAAPSFGILASSVGGPGAAGGELNVDEGGGGADGGYGGAGYAVNVTLDAGSTITTSGSNAVAVVGRSLGGPGGAGGQVFSGGIASVPGDGGQSGNGGLVTITSAAQISTTGTAAHGIVAQSMSGAGGNGGTGAGIFYSSGGAAGPSGSVAGVSVTNTGQIGTSGESAFGIEAQAIGGGSGTGGSSSGGFVELGGASAYAADGGPVTVANTGTIGTTGNTALGILGQSIGGGGGNGGDASGVIASIGGSGTGGGNGGSVTMTLGGGVITTQGQLAHGVVAQSIGGGGGNGGNATSNSLEVSLAVGGLAGGGGGGGSVSVTGTGGTIGTSQTKSAGLVAQSIGGGGGTGGAAYAVSAGLDFSAAVAVGGSGGDGGQGGPSMVSLSGTAITTGQATVANTNQNPVDAFGVVVQSVGGGGGLGGAASATAVAAAIPLPVSRATYAGALAVGVGGTGGNGGAAVSAQLTLTNGASITTQGQGSHAVLVQSIGGGGGSGGDSSALASTIGYGRASTANGTNVWDADLSVAIGGSGKDGGTGGTAAAFVGSGKGGAPVTITTYGDYANGVMVQSIGGGGGNAGIGSSTTARFGDTRTLTVSVGLGGSVGTGQVGAAATAMLYAGNTISTYGASSYGLLVQSQGGGGGAAQGGTVNLGTAFTLDDDSYVKPGFAGTFNWGGTGGAGGNGGPVTVTVAGSVLTYGGDSAGVVAQSVGGGGGTGGSAGGEASADNPIDPVSRVRSAINSVIGTTVGLTASFSASLGGQGGVTGEGGTVAVSLPGSIGTAGDWAAGVLAQSVGGGGGKGGTAVSNTSGLLPSLSFAVGGSGSAGGNGGQVAVGLSGGTVCTGFGAGCTTPNGAGFAAFGIVAQSVGGGGGMGADGSAQANGILGLGASAAGGSGGASGTGGPVVLGGSGTVRTAGYGASAVVLQSIGGGGGIVGSGTSQSSSAAGLSLQIGGGSGAYGNGGTVTVDNATLAIATAGTSAYGILAQSIGGGGGLGVTAPGATVTLGGHAGASSGTGNGGSVSVTTAPGTVITTSGLSAHGILAQSIGGGGGVSAAPSTAGVPVMSDLAISAGFALPEAQGAGGNVSVAFNGAITTTGAGAYGILAQSVGNGGGLGVVNGGLYASAFGIPGNSSITLPGTVSVTASGTIQATGANAVGIFAQSAAINRDGGGMTQYGQPISITINGQVQGGSGAQGYGVWSSGGASNTLTINAGSSLSALSGNAIYQSQFGTLDVSNAGTVSGSYALNGGTFSNASGATLVTGATAAAALTVNAGRMRIGAPGSFSQTAMTGNLQQTATGTTVVDADFSGRRTSLLTVTGNASLAGTILPAITTVLPNIPLPVMTVQGTLSGLPAGGRSTLFGYGTSQSGNQVLLSATSADFTPAGLPLSAAREAVANHLQSAWEAGGTPALGGLFALLGNTADASPSAYAAQLQQLSPNAAFAPGARALANAGSFANATLSCPGFQGTSAMLVEGSCGWMRATGRTTSQTSGNGIGTYTLDGMTWQIGGQKEVAPGFLIGGSLAYEESWLSSSDGLTKGNGQAGYGALTAKYQTGPWLFAASAFGGAGQFNTERYIGLPGYTGVAKGSPDTSNVGVLLRAAYTVGTETLYLRPNLNLSVVHVSTGSYAESGAGALNLSVSGASQTVAVATPMLELGGRVVLGPDLLLRPYAAAGMSLQSTNGWSQTARLASAPAGASGFTTTLPIDPVAGRVAVGVQLYTTRQIAFRLQYDGEFSGTLTSHAGSFVASIGF